MTYCESCVHNRLCKSLKARFSDEANKEFNKILFGQVEISDCDFFYDRKFNMVPRMNHEKALCDLSEKNDSLKKEVSEYESEKKRLSEELQKHNESLLRIMCKLERSAGILDAMCYMLPEESANAATIAFDNIEYVLKEMSGG